MITLTIVAVMSATTFSSARAESQHPLAQLCSSIQQQASESEAYVGFVILDLEDDTRCAGNASESFRTASLYKLFVLAEAYQQIAAGSFSLDEQITIEQRHWVDDPLSLRQTEPIELTAAEALRLMITFSQNASALALYERLQPAAVDQVPSRLGLNDTTLSGAYVTTAADVAEVFRGLYRGDIVSPAASSAMLALLADQQINDLIPLSLPLGTTVAHKTGLVAKYLHDAGIVFAPGGDYVTVVLTRWDDDIDDSYDAIHDLAGVAYGVFAEQFDRPLPRPLPPPLAAPGESGTFDQALSVPDEFVPPIAVNLETAQPPLPGPRLVSPSAVRWQRLDVQLSAVVLLAGLLAVTLLQRSRLRQAKPSSAPRSAYARVIRRSVMADREVFMRFGSRSRGDREPVLPETADDASQPPNPSGFSA
jgi:beta-lactamase class A